MRAAPVSPVSSLTCLWLLLICGPSHADSCDAVKATIEAKMRESGMSSFTLIAVDVAASTPVGRVVGNCASGARKIVQLAVSPPAPGAAVASAASAARVAAAVKPRDNVLTECKDGTMSVGGTCKK